MLSKQPGKKSLYVVEEAMAAAIARLPIEDASGSMIIDLGGGTTDIAVFFRGYGMDKTMKRMRWMKT